MKKKKTRYKSSIARCCGKARKTSYGLGATFNLLYRERRIFLTKIAFLQQKSFVNQ